MRPTALLILLKTMRAEVIVLGVLWVALLLAGLGTWLGFELDGSARACMPAWIATAEGSPTCRAAISGWSTLDNSVASQVVTAAGLFAPVAGLVLGVALVGRELETGTAEFTWSLALNRRRWFIGEFGRLLVAVVVPLAALGGVLAGMEMIRTAGGLWGTAYPDAELFGIALVARGCLGLGLGALFGAWVGRSVPALLCAGVIVIGLMFATGLERSTFAYLPDAQSNDPAFVATLLANDEVEIRFLTADQKLLTRSEAAASVPTGEPAAQWLQEHDSVLVLGISWARTTAWQMIVTVFYLAIAGSAAIGAGVVTVRRRPFL